jgi:hypothetical protein
VTVTQSEVIKALRFLLFIFPFHFLLSVRAQLLNASIGSLWWHLFALEYYCEYTISATFWLVYWTWTWLFLGLLIDLVDTLRAKQSSIWCAPRTCVSLIDLVDSLSAFASVAVQNMCSLVMSKSWYSAYYICNIIQGDRGHVLPIEISSDKLLVMCVSMVCFTVPSI